MKNIYTVYDKASETHIAPFAMNTDRDAIEGFRLVTNEKDTPYNKFPADYTLIKIGSFDDRTGNLKLLDHNELACAADLIKIEE